MIEIRNLCLAQGSFTLDNISLRLEPGEYGTLMGETGCGKTTLIEAICGLRPVRDGVILAGGVDVTKLPPAERQIGYVPQDAVLFPTMRVDHQILFGLEIRGVDRKIRHHRLEELAEKLAITTILRRYPGHLSGGEKQRVALARALAFRPRLLCLDEPLSAIDRATHQQLAALLQTIHRTESITILHITHSHSEARSLGTRHFRLTAGSIQEVQEVP